MRVLRVSFCCFVLFLTSACANADQYIESGYKEAVFSVRSLDDYSEFFQEVAGWRVLSSGDVGRDQLRAWGLDNDAHATEVVLHNPGTERGFVRLVQFDGVEQQEIRSNAQTWDTGGWFDVNTRILSMAEKFAEFQARGWQASSDPVQFTFGPFVVKEWLARGPDGIVIAMIERVAPPLEGWPQLKEMSRFFNATQIVPDIKAAREFYTEKLGFNVYLHHDAPSREAGPNVLGIPHNLATEITRNVSIVHPKGENEGSIEILAFDGLTGADWSSRAQPPNLGILMLRFPVNNIGAFHQHVLDKDIEVEYAPTAVDLSPYGSVSMMAIRAPGGALLEFFEQQEQ